jgi:hypothetical protein
LIKDSLREATLKYYDIKDSVPIAQEDKKKHYIMRRIIDADPRAVPDVVLMEMDAFGVHPR